MEQQGGPPQAATLREAGVAEVVMCMCEQLLEKVGIT